MYVNSIRQWHYLRCHDYFATSYGFIHLPSIVGIRRKSLRLHRSISSIRFYEGHIIKLNVILRKTVQWHSTLINTLMFCKSPDSTRRPLEITFSFSLVFVPANMNWDGVGIMIWRLKSKQARPYVKRKQLSASSTLVVVSCVLCPVKCLNFWTVLRSALITLETTTSICSSPSMSFNP